MNVIQTHGLTKRFGTVTATDRISLNVRQGEIYGFLGLNGAGKTTLIRQILGMIKPEEGEIFLFGEDTKQHPVDWNRIGYLVETPFAYPNLSVRENLEVFCLLRGIECRGSIDRIIDILKLGEYTDRKARHLSLGNNQRLGLAKALIHKPSLLILDEPVNGLDPAGIVEIREYLRDLAQNHQTTIFLSSHILSEIARLATRIGIVHEGKLITEFDTEELHRQIVRKLRIHTADDPKALQLLAGNGYNEIQLHSGSIELTDLKAIEHPEDIARILVGHGLPPSMLVVSEEDLEHYFLRMIGNNNSTYEQAYTGIES